MELIIKDKILGSHFTNFSKDFSIPIDFCDIIIKAKSNGISQKGIRVLGCIALNLYTHQFGRKKNDPQLSLFEEEWFSFDSDSALGVDLSFRYADFLPKGNKNTSQVKEGILELQKWLYTIEFVRVDKNTGKTKDFSYRSSVISSFLTDSNSGFKITLNKYWYRLLIDLSKGFNTFNIQALFSLSGNALSFYAYILKLPVIEYIEKFKDAPLPLFNQKGTYMKIETFIENFELPYNSPSHIKEKFLDRIKKELDQKMDWSFNYAFSDDNKKLAIVGYQTTNFKKEVLKLGDTTLSEALSIKRSITDKAKRYKLDRQDIFMMMEIYLKYSYFHTLKASDKKASLRGLMGNLYVIKFIEIVDDYVLSNSLNSIFTNEEKLKIRNHLRNKF